VAIQTDEGDGTGERESGAALQGLGARSLARFGLRLLLACALLGGALGVARPFVFPAVARVAGDLVAWSTPPGMVTQVRWEEPRARFVLVSAPLKQSIGVQSVSLLLILVLPAAFAWALPAPGRLGAAALALLACFAVGSLVVGQDLLAFFDAKLIGEGITAFGPVRTEFHATWVDLGWDLGMLAIPAAACILALWPLLEGSGPRPTLGQRLRRRPLAAAAGGLALAGLLVAADAGASRRRAEAGAPGRFLRELAERNPDLPEHFLGLGEASLEAGRINEADAYFRRAGLFPSSRGLARRGLARVRAARTERSSQP